MAKKRTSSNNAEVSLDSVKSRVITNEDGKMICDKELIDLALRSIDDHVNSTGEPTNIDPAFVEWLRDAADAEDIVAHKKATVVKQTMNFIK